MTHRASRPVLAMAAALVLLTAAAGTVLGHAALVGADPKTMVASGLALAPGAYEARWTAVASDGDLTRGIVSFTVALDAAPTSSDATATSGSTADASGPSGSEVIIPIVAGLVVVAIVALLVLRRGRAA